MTQPSLLGMRSRPYVLPLVAIKPTERPPEARLMHELKQLSFLCPGWSTHLFTLYCLPYLEVLALLPSDVI